MRATSRLLILSALPLAALLALARPACAQSSGIVAVVDGDVITKGDVDNRGRLLALSTGLQVTPDVLDRLRSQTTKQLIDERLRLQEVQRRHIVVSDKEISDALHGIEQRNGMQSGGMREKLAGSGVDLRTLIDQLRVQIGWTDVIRQQLGQESQITQKEIEDQQKLLQVQAGKPEYRVSEIFVPVDDPSNTADAQRFSDAVIQQLRAGAPFAVVAAQFSQSQTALQGGDLGWLQPNQLDPEVAHVVEAMPINAISNPIRAPGGFSIVTLRAKREIGRDLATVLSIRQVFLPFATPLNPQAPTEQQRQTLEKAKGLSASLRTCDQVDQAAKASGSSRPSDPGEVRLESINPPAFRATLASLPDGRATQPLVANDGIAVMMVCSRQEKNMASESKEDIANRLIGERVELLSRQLLRDLHRKALIDLHSEKSRPADRGPLPTLREVVARHGLDARRKLGQHFLLDANLTARIARAAGPLAGRHVIEVGPGPGGLTRALLATEAASVVAIEIDARAVGAVQELAAADPRLRVIEADALDLDAAALVPPPRHVIANLPYNVATPLLVGWLRQAASYERLTLMFQQEVADRICAAPDTEAYGRLSVLAQWTCAASLALRLPPAAFTPPPKVWSAVVSLTPHPGQPPPALFAAMERLTAAAFGQRRKMLRGSLKPLGGQALLDAAGISAERRAETLSVEEFDRLARLTCTD